MREWADALKARLERPSEQPEGGPNRAGVAVILTEELEALLVRRSERVGDPWSGQWALPGGMWQNGDENMLETVRREVLEEVGIDVYELEFLGWLATRSPRNRPELSVYPSVFLSGEVMEPRLGSELSEWRWAPLMLLSLEKRTMRSSLGLREAEVYVYGEIVVWGLTATVVRDLLELLKPSRRV